MNRNTTIVLVIAFGLLFLYVLVVQRPKDEAASGTPTPGALSSTVWSFTSDQVTGFSVVDMAESRRIEVAKDAQGAWMVTAPESRRADDQQVSSAVGQLAGLSVSTSITKSTDLSPFGVLTPAYALGVELADGSQLKAVVGDKTPTGTGYYLLRDGETEVLVVYSSSIDGLIGLLDKPPYFVPTPTLAPTVALTATVPAPTATP